MNNKFIRVCKIGSAAILFAYRIARKFQTSVIGRNYRAEIKFLRCL
jgi:hypothetical protein